MTEPPEDLLAWLLGPELLAWLAETALTGRDEHRFGSPAYSLLTRLALVASDVLEFLEAPPPVTFDDSPGQVARRRAELYAAGAPAAADDLREVEG